MKARSPTPPALLPCLRGASPSSVFVRRLRCPRGGGVQDSLSSPGGHTTGDGAQLAHRHPSWAGTGAGAAALGVRHSLLRGLLPAALRLAQGGGAHSPRASGCPPGAHSPGTRTPQCCPRAPRAASPCCRRSRRGWPVQAGRGSAPRVSRLPLPAHAPARGEAAIGVLGAIEGAPFVVKQFCLAAI